MHLLATTSTSLDEIVEAVDLGQPPGEIVVLSFADSDLAGLAAAWEAERAVLPSVRLAHLRDLRHPMSVDLWIDRVAAHARVIVVRLLGGLDWWRYGIERLSALARERGITLAVLPGEDRDDARLAAASTLPSAELDTLLGFFREGGGENLRALLRTLARHAGHALEAQRPRPVPRFAGYLPGEGAVDLGKLISSPRTGQAGRADHLLSRHAARRRHGADRRAVRALSARAASRRRALFVTSLKDRDAAAFLRGAFALLAPAVIVTTTAFAAGGNIGEPTPLDAAGVPVLQVVSATTRRAAWRDSAARPRRRRSRDARRAARTRRPHPRRRRRLQGSAAAARRARLHGADEPSRAGPRGDGRRPDRRTRALARLAARRAADRGADAGLSRRTRAHRLRGRARRAGERDRAPRRSRRRRLRGARRSGNAASFARCARRRQR